MNKCAGGFKWRCSTRHRRGCRAYLLINDKEAIVESCTNHNHIESKYMMTVTGDYVSL